MLTSHSKCCSMPITNTRRCEHVTPVLQQLHWLPVGQHVQFKITTLVYNALHDLLPAYLMEDCQHVSVTGRRQLRWSDVDTCLVQQINICLHNRSLIHAAGRQLRNSLSTQLRESDITLGQFWRAIKTHLWSLTAAASSDLFFCAPCTHRLT